MATVQCTLDLFLTTVYIGLICSIIWFSITLYHYYKLKHLSLKNDIEYRRLENENKNKTVEYSNRVLELIRSIVGQIAVIKFRTFQDTHDMNKITKANVEALVKSVAEMANESLNMNNIFFKDTFFTKHFYERYIVETSVILIKQMVDKAISELNEENY